MATKPAPATSFRPANILRIADWKNSPTLQVELMKVLELPVVQKAFATLMTAAMPNEPAVSSAGVSADVLMLRTNNLYHNRSGFTQFYKALHNLATTANGTGPSAPWGVLEPEDE